MNYKEVFEALRATRSRNDKIAILKQADERTKDILEYAYNPFKHYYINKIPKVSHAPEENDIFNDWNYENLLDELCTRTLSGNIAKAALIQYLKAASPEDAELLGMILKKDLRAGISAKTINAAIPGLVPEFGAMLAKKWDPERYNDNLVMSIKYDGVRAIFKDGKFFSRNGIEYTGLGHLADTITPPWSFDGELIIPGVHFQESSGYIRSDDPTPNAVFHVFDIPDSVLKFRDRYDLLLATIDALDSPYIKLVKHVRIKNIEHIESTFKKALDAGYEGLVIKPRDHKYQTKRSWDWMKLKVENDEDLPCVGFYEGEGKYEGMLGGLVVERSNGCHVRVGSGFSDQERLNIWSDTESFLGLTVEVAYHEETPDGSLRHPVYKGFRYDK